MDQQSAKRKSGERQKAYKFRGNQFTKTGSAKPNQRVSASSKKLNVPDELMTESSAFGGYGLIDKELVYASIKNCLVCKICFGPVNIYSDRISGLSEKVVVNCEICGDVSSIRNSIMSGVKGNKPEINTRFIYAMRCIGQGLASAKTFCAVMDLPPPIYLSAYNNIVKNIEKATSEVAEQSMARAAKEEAQLSEYLTDITVSGDGTWKTRGHSSLVGVCTLIGAISGKVIDTEILSSRCKGCEVWKGVHAGSDYESWKNKHSDVCVKNHSGSAGMMEVVGMSRIFLRSEAKHQVRYTNYIGDGDCKTFQAIEKAEPYGKDFLISKIECVGHIQKRMGTRLRKRKAAMRGKKLSDGKSIGGKGRLTDAVIDKFTVYYGNAIRKHSDSAKDMQTAIWAIFYHTRSNDNEPTHNFCPKGGESWCPYQKAVASNTVQNYKHTSFLPTPVMDSIKDIFKDLSMPSLLKKCLGGHTQNANESLNSMIWKFCPKTSGSGPHIVTIATNEAIICFNDGQVGRLNILSELRFKIGQFARSYALEADKRRVVVAEKRAALCTLEARRAKRCAKKSIEEDHLLKEGVVYAAGEF